MKNLELLQVSERAADFTDIFEQYMKATDLWDIEDAYERLAEEPALFPKELLRETPAATILVPVELMTAETEDVLHTLRLIQRAALQTGPLEVFLWMNSRMIEQPNNMPYEAWERATNLITKKAGQAFHEIVTVTASESFDPSYVRIRPALDYPHENATMLDIRATAMDCIGYDGYQRGFPYDHPVEWIDADTTIIAKGAIAQMITRLKTDPEAFLVQPNLFFTGQPNDTRPIRERESSEKYAALYAIARKMFEKNVGHNAKNVYIEECGISMRLGDYFTVDGLRAHYPEYRSIGETARLRNNAKDTGIAKVVSHEPGARMGTSYRNIQARAGNMPPNGNFSRTLNSKDYATYSELRRVADESDWEIPAATTITESTAHKLIADLAASYSCEPTERQIRILGGLIKRFEFPPDEE